MVIEMNDYFLETNIKLPLYSCKYIDCKYCDNLKICVVWNKNEKS